MDRVYENAFLTVVALSGSNAAQGLTKISKRNPYRDNSEQRNLFNEQNGTYSIAISHISLAKQIQYSHWNTHGWTYQEQLLSPQKLYFSRDEVFYECLCGTRREGYSDDASKGVTLRPGAPWYSRSKISGPESTTYTISVPPPGRLWNAHSSCHDKDFQTIMSTYTRRRLTEPGDILNALTGIYHKYYESGGY